MEANQFLFDILTFMQTVFGLIIGVVVIQLLIFLLLAKAIGDSQNPREVGSAIFGYIMLAIGVILMSLSAITALMGLLGETTFNTEVYLSLVLVFAIGGLLYLWHDYRLREIPQKIKSVPETIYFFAIKTIGQLSLVLAILYLSLSITLTSGQPERWWSMPLSILIYGLFLTWITSETGSKAKKVTKAHSIKPVAKKKTTAKKRRAKK